MKHMLRAVLVLLLSAGVASAAAIADNDQFQGQGDGGFAAAGAPGVIGLQGGLTGQLGYGFSASEAGDQAFEIQSQSQVNVGGVAAVDGTGQNYFISVTATAQEQESGSATGFLGDGTGIAANAQAQGIALGAAGVSAEGQFGVAGSAGAAGGLSASFAFGDAVAGNEQAQVGAGAYEQQTVGPQSIINQSGEQVLGTSTTSGAAIVGAGLGAAGVVQYGGTVAVNDGNAGYMEGQGTAEAGAGVAAGGLGLAGGSAEAFGTQTHRYEQAAVGPGSFQQQAGEVSTTVSASTP